MHLCLYELISLVSYVIETLFRTKESRNVTYNTSKRMVRNLATSEIITTDFEAPVTARTVDVDIAQLAEILGAINKAKIETSKIVLLQDSSK